VDDVVRGDALEREEHLAEDEVREGVLVGDADFFDEGFEVAGHQGHENLAPVVASAAACAVEDLEDVFL
jgi:hypothetical protein